MNTPRALPAPTCLRCGATSDATVCDRCFAGLAHAHGRGSHCPTCGNEWDDCNCGTVRERIARDEDRW